jgi:hypothetical protein
MSISGIRMERLRIGVYIIVPVLAVLIYSQPVVHEGALRSRRYVVYNESDIPDFKSAVKKLREEKSHQVAGDNYKENSGNSIPSSSSTSASSLR